MLTVVPGEGCGHEGSRDDSPSLIGEIVRAGARRMLAEALQAWIDAYIAAHAAGRDERGRRLVVRNGCHQPREILTSAGAVQVTVPRVNGKRTGPGPGERRRLSSAIVPPWARKTPKITGVLPLLYLHGLSPGGFVPALGQFPGSAAGLPVKELIALAGGYRESTGSWAGLLRDCARRGMRAPVLAAGDGALGFWGALREVFPGAEAARCWFHQTANGLAALPESAHPGAKKALAEIWGADDKEHARAAKASGAACGVKFPQATAKITGDLDELPAFYDCPARHWLHLRTANPIEPAFATVRHRAKVTKGPGPRAAGLAMAFKLIESAQDRWRAVNAPHLAALVRAGATFTGGKLVERTDELAGAAA